MKAVQLLLDVLAARPQPTRGMPKSQDPHDALFSIQSIDDQIRTYREKSCSKPLRQNRAHFGLVRQRFFLRDQQRREPFRGRRIIECDVLDDILEIDPAARGKDYLPSHPRNAWRISSVL